MQDIMLTFSGLLYLIYCDNLANFYRILRWVMSKLVSLDMEWPSYEALVWKEALTICQDRLFGSCLYVLSLSSVLGSFIHMYCDTGSLGKCTPASGNQKFYGGSFFTGLGTWGGVILAIWTFFETKNSFMWILNIN